jgi:hypothetical protein
MSTDTKQTELTTEEASPTLAKFPFITRSRETQAIIERVKDLQPDELLIYLAAKETLGFSLQTQPGYGRLQSARRALRREGIEIAVEPGVGIRRLNNGGVAKSLDKDVRHISRSTHRAIQKGKNVKASELPPPERTEFIARLSQVAAIHHSCSSAMTKRLTAAAQASEERLPLAKTLALFQNGSD